jgi:hypothetical protein
LLLLACIGLVLSGGCVGGVGPLLALVLCGLSLVLAGCGDDSDEVCRNYQACVGGRLTTVNLCCPVGTECNYGQVGVKTCASGMCVNGLEACPEERDAGADAALPNPEDGCEGSTAPQCVANCDGYVGSVCDEGKLVEACCPMGVACNFSLGLMICSDGSCAYGGCDDVDAGS